MKKTTLSLFALFLLTSAALVSCRLIGLNGSGNVTTENRPVQPFQKLNLEGVFKVILSQDGGPEWVKVETDDNLQPKIVLSQTNGELTINHPANSNFHKYTKMIVYVNVKDLTNLQNSCVGTLETQGALTCTDLRWHSQSVGKSTLNLNAKTLVARLENVGACHLSGTVGEALIDNQSVGKLEAWDFRADKLTLKNEAVGAAEVYAQTEINIEHSGVGTVRYKGPATVNKIKDEGVGKVSKAD